MEYGMKQLYKEVYNVVIPLDKAIDDLTRRTMRKDANALPIASNLKDKLNSILNDIANTGYVSPADIESMKVAGYDDSNLDSLVAINFNKEV